MRFERAPAFSLLISRNQPQLAAEGAPFDGVEYWQSQLKEPARFRHWWTSATNVGARQFSQTQDAEDNASKTIASVLKGASGFHGGNDQAWFLKIVVNNGYDELRRRKRRPAESLEALAEESGEHTRDNVSENPDKAARRGVVREAIGNAMQYLSREQRQIAVLCDMEGLSYDDAAKKLGIAIGTVKSRLSRGRAKLKKGLIKQGISFDFLED